MRRELIIEGQRMDLSDTTSFTLEYVSNVLTGGSGKINLSKSYTIKLPRTRNNTMVLSDPGMPSHASGCVRRFLSARYYENGIDLLGPAQAYVLKTTAGAFEIALIWNALPELQALSESDKTLNDVQDLPTLQWIADDSDTPDYTSETDGAFFGRYDSGLGVYPYQETNTAPHPSMGVLPLVDKILTQAGVPYVISSQRVREALSRMSVLSAPSHKPSRAMEEVSGTRCTNLRITSGRYTSLLFDVQAMGWDSPLGGVGSPNNGFGINVGTTGGVKRLHVSLNFQGPQGTDLSAAYVVVQGLEYIGSGASLPSEGEELTRVYFTPNASGAYEAVAELDLEVDSWEYFAVNVARAPQNVTFTVVDSSKAPLTVWRVHDTIPITFDNRFPIADNLPKIKQWDFIKASMVLSGAVPVVQQGALLLMGYDEAFDKVNAYDWSDKVSSLDSVAYSVQNWAQDNVIAYEKDGDTPLSFDPDASLMVNDSTLKASRELFKLPFAATQGSSAIHYRVTRDKDGLLVVDDIDIKPRIMTKREGDLALTALEFGQELYGDGLLRSKYLELQRVMWAPVVVTASIRINELDLAGLDLRRPVYLAQYGQYYCIVKVQTSNSGVSKVELIQIP